MDIFISWSGKRSRAFAEALRDWLPMIINAARPFLSSSDIDKGARWSTEIATRLEKAKAGIICLTPSNMQSEWILFEAGALSKTLADTYVCTLLIDMKPTDVKGPLSQFQATTTSETDMLQLVKTLNSKLGESAVQVSHLEKAFKLMWPDLGKQIENLPKEAGAKAPGRSAEDMLEELLGLVRNLSRPLQLASTPSDRQDDVKKMHLLIRQIFKEELGEKFLRLKLESSRFGFQGAALLSISDAPHLYHFTIPLDASSEMIRRIAQRSLEEDRENKIIEEDMESLADQ